MPTHQKMVKRVILIEGDIRKVAAKPDEVEDLISQIKGALGLDCNFTLTCNLTNMADIEKAIKSNPCA